MDDRFAALLEQYHDELRNGSKRPSASENVADLEADLRQELEEAVGCLRMIERVRRTAHDFSWTAADSQGVALRQAPTNPARIGRFEILEELGRGGHGIVFLAWDPAARRQVALKTPHPDALFTPELRERFLREGVAAARLAHPNIVSVLEVNHSGPVCYIVSTYCEGKSLATLLAESRGPIPLVVAVEWVAQLADAVEHAHRHGILHRDLKPANVVLAPGPIGLADESELARHSVSAESAPLVPKVTDFGLAKLTDSHDLRSRTGVMLGTPAYMAPEQVDGTLGTIGRPTDIYGLGTILFELLTGRPPFVADSQADVLRQIASGDPLAPRDLRLDLPRDLEAICLRCLQRRPQDRYSSATALATDLRRFLAGEVTWARPLGIFSRVLKWARRRRATAATLVVGVLAILIFTIGAIWHLVKLDVALQTAEEARGRAESREKELQQLIYFRDMQTAHQALDEQDVRKASSLLKRHRSPQHGFLWGLLSARTCGQPMRVMAHRGHVHAVDFTPDGRSVVSAAADGLVQIWDASTGKRRSTLCSGVPEISFACCSPDGRTIAAAESTGNVRLWDVQTGKSLSVWSTAELPVINCLAWSPDGRKLAAAGSPGASSVVWEVATGNALTIPVGHTEEVNGLAYSRNSRLLATASSDESVCLWDLEHGCRMARLEPEQTHLTCVRFSHDDRNLATSGVKGTVKVWNTSDWSLAASYETGADRVDCIAFSPDDADLAFADHFGIVREWDWKLDRLRRVVDSQQGRILSVAYSSDGNALATAACDGTLCLWDLRREESTGSIALAGGGMAAFSPDGKKLVFGNEHGEVDVFDLHDRSKYILSDLSRAPFAGVALWDSERLAIAGAHQIVCRSYLTANGPSTQLLTTGAHIQCMCITRDRRVLLTGDSFPPYLVRLWDLKTGQSLGTLQGHEAAVRALVCSRSADIAASASGDGTVRLWDLNEKRQVRMLEGHHSDVCCVAFSSDGSMLASGGGDCQVRFWNPATGDASPLVLNHVAEVRSIAFCPDEPLLATGDTNGHVRLWTLPNGEELMVLGQLRDEISCLVFSADARFLAAAAERGGHGGEVRIWSAPR